MPTSGGLYWWTHFFASPNLRNPLCFLVGYSNTLGFVGGLCSIDYGFACKIFHKPLNIMPYLTYVANANAIIPDSSDVHCHVCMQTLNILVITDRILALGSPAMAIGKRLMVKYMQSFLYASYAMGF